MVQFLRVSLRACDGQYGQKHNILIYLIGMGVYGVIAGGSIAVII